MTKIERFLIIVCDNIQGIIVASYLQKKVTFEICVGQVKRHWVESTKIYPTTFKFERSNLESTVL